ncbi:STAS domain-containing protein [Bacillus infantis]|uniref:STAS domain-containing protein n=1 Tax=Bacillus infantis TaxID=324767 RepID=A0A5D4QXJ2_9BACI|nr:STAS domain-containing protein [Bacillus infantis]TYS43129.1 STAS domain-containing protein [Bacillus infantis]
MQDNKLLPLPYFKINEKLDILESSAEADSLFLPAGNLLELIDDESAKKAKTVLLNKMKRRTELNMKTHASPFALVTVHISWNGDIAHLLLIEEDDKINILAGQVEKHRQRLAETNLDLLESKETAERSYRKVLELSSPFIHISDELVLIPLFGELSEQLINQNKDRLLDLLHDSNVNRILVDFNGVGSISRHGLILFQQLLSQFSLLGAESVLIGINPEQAKTIHNNFPELEAKYINSLHKAIKKGL